MRFEVRYTRSFLLDLGQMQPGAYERVYQFVFYQFPGIQRLSELPHLRPLDDSGILYRFRLEDCAVALEVTGNIVKFLRILPESAIKLPQT